MSDSPLRLGFQRCDQLKVALHFLHTRTPRPSSSRLRPSRDGLPHSGQTTLRLEIWTGASRSRMPPWIPLLGFGLVCRLIMFTRSTMALPLPARIRRTRPRAPRALPVVTSTWSFFLTFTWVFAPFISDISDDLRRERHDLHDPPLAQLPRHRTEHARADRLAGVVDQHRGVLVEADVAAVLAPLLLDRPHDHRLDHLPLLHRAVGRRLLDRGGDHVPQPAVLARRAATQVDAGDLLGARIVRHVENRSH